MIFADHGCVGMYTLHYADHLYLVYAASELWILSHVSCKETAVSWSVHSNRSNLWNLSHETEMW